MRLAGHAEVGCILRCERSAGGEGTRLVDRWQRGVALKGGRDGLDAYRALGPQIACCLNPAGHALIELGQGQAEAVQAILEAASLRVDKVLPDLAGIPRCLVAVLGSRTP